ncbi:TrlF family AAA-like ATPase [Candidatus Thiosymbion oneisti]|uniref:TrlF family AAA-like ATPase n=1 Tax=Candidatus Thiosymbion oneisti TaxID=589554 RepID=UPI000AAC2406|nr:PHP-associated domain-containing protein [Candidatus Thiosymbion oneisti]
MSDERSFLGSKWWKFDFHTHTPKSSDYGCGDDSFKAIEPEAWLKQTMQSGLDCVVVTDHNSGEWIDALKAKNEGLRDLDAKPDWYRALTIFPGVEINVADSSSRVHLLAVFDPSYGSQKITSVLGSCGITTGFGDDQKTSTRTGFVDTVDKIKEAGGIAIPAHIDGSKGLLAGVSSLTPELKRSLQAVYAAEFRDLHKFDQAESSLKKAVDRLAKVAGSDAHRPDEIGKYFSWLKMGRPSIEGLRLALIDREFCVRNQSEDPNRRPDIFLSQLTIRNMSHCGRISGRPFVTPLHPHFNAVIGGRGTGKSTLLESIRIASRRDQNLAAEAPRVKDELDKFMALSRDKGVMLDDTEILLALHRRGKNYRLRWRFDGQGMVLEEQSETGWQESEAADLKGRFPISIFSQRQINELASNPRGLLAVVDRAPEVDRAEWESRWKSEKSRFLQLRERKRALSRQLAEERQIRARLGDVENDLDQYEKKGHGEILKHYQKRSRQKNGLPDDRVFDELAAGIRGLAANAELSDFPAHLFDDRDETTAEVRSIHEQATQKLKEVGDALGKLAAGVDVLKAQRTERILSSAWYRAVQESTDTYEGLVKEYEEKKSPLSLSLYGDWVQQRNQLQQLLNQLGSVRKELEATKKEIDETRKRLLELRTELQDKRQGFLDRVIGSNAFVRMELVPFGDVSTLEEDYRSLLNLDTGKFIRSVCDRETRQGILWKLYDWEDTKTPESDLPQLIFTIKSETFAIAEGRASGNHGAFGNRLKKLLDTQPAVFDQLDAWWPEDLLRVKYSKNQASGKFENLEKGSSAGQKAAAILAFLLSYGNEPLVIDQPEDDLDNSLIYDLIVKQIHENKNRRQLIIVTHNPNIVVNGDAELVHVLEFGGGQVQIDRQGGLEEASIREAICAIMEGGPEAFDKRYQRITLEV